MNFDDDNETKENIEQDPEDMYSSYTHTEEENNNNNIQNTSIEPEFNGNSDERNNSLEDHSKLTKASSFSKFILIGFYALIVILGVLAFFMIRANKYEFYLNKDSVLISMGSSYQIELTPKNERYFDYLNYDYTIGDETIAKVDEFGTVTALKPGTTTLKISLSPSIFSSKTIKIISEAGNVSNVTVGVYKDDKLTFPKDVQLNAKQSVTLGAIINDREDLNVSANWTSTDPNVASIDSFGNVTGNSDGVAYINGEIGGVESSIMVVVSSDNQSVTPTPTVEPTIEPTPSNDPTPNNNTPTPTGTIEPTPTKTPSPTPTKTPTPTPTKTPSGSSSSNKVDLGVASQITKYVGEELQITAKYNGKQTNSATWSSSNVKIATVSNGLIKCKDVGTAVITAEVNGVKGTTKLVVKNKPGTTPTPTKTPTPTATGSSQQAPNGQQFSVNNVQLNKTSMTVSKGSTGTFTITVNKSIAKIAIKSSDASVAKVTVSGASCNPDNNTCMLDSVFDNTATGKATLDVTITGVKAGTATITITAEELIDSNDKDLSGKSGKIGVLVK